MSNLITSTQERYLLALKENVGDTRFAEFKSQLRIPKELPISKLTKDDAYKLITQMIAESSSEAVEKALSVALNRKIGPRRRRPTENSPKNDWVGEKS